MEKYLKIGERYVQWIALGIGGLYLLLMAYFYILTPPITEPVDKKDYLPGEVDLYIKSSAAAKLDADIHHTKSWVELKTGDPVADITGSLNRPPIYVRNEPAKDWIIPGGPATKIPETIFALVKPPAPEVAKVPPAAGTSVLNVPQPVPAAAALPAGNPAAAPAAPAAPVQPVVDPQDHDWNTYAWVVNAKALDNAFQAANINKLPPQLYLTSFLRVEVVRQELFPNGKVGPEKVLPDIPTVTGPPISMLPMPPETANVDDKKNYLMFATQNASAILTPPFFEVVYGTQWYLPGTEKQPDTYAPLGTTPGAAPAPTAPGAPAMPIAPAAGPGGLPIGAGGGVHGPGGFMPQPPGLAAPRHDRPAFPVPAAPAAPGGLMPAAPGGVPGAAANNAPINPAQSPDITIYTHDWTVEPGHVYHYKMRYWISNPLFQVQEADVKPAESSVLACQSPYSQWTPPLEIPSRYKFWVRSFKRNVNYEVVFDVFMKKPGLPGGFDRSTVRAVPGDAIGPSSWLLVDVRNDPSHRDTTYYYFLISDPTGRIERRDVEHDSKDAEHLEMLDRTGAAAAAGG